MRNTLLVWTLVLALAGFVFPWAWIGAVVAGLCAIGASPGGYRPDGKMRTGGLFGGILDDIAIASKMTDCPYCRQKVMRTATKCPHCQEWIKPQAVKTCPLCKIDHPVEDTHCIKCGGPI